MSLRFPLSALAAATAIVVAAPALAQNTTSAISGLVTEGGRGVGGAIVTIVHDESRSLSTTTTDSSGRYTARGLRVGGPYTITVTKDGRTEKREGVFLVLAETLTLDVALGVPTTVVVTGRAAARFDSTAMGAGTQLGSTQLNALPSIQRNLQDYARLDPRVAQTDKDRGEISALGLNTRYNSITIDGVSINDPFGLESNNLPTLKQPISMDAIQSVQINLSNFDVTQKGYVGANINAITKSGTNEFKGSVYYVYRDDELTGDRYNRTTGAYAPPPAYEETTKGFTLGGPIVKDRLFFFLGYEELASSRNSPSFGPVGSPLTNVGITPQQIAAAQEVARTRYGIDIGNSETPAGVELTVKDILLKLDWNINNDQRASVRYSKTEQAEPIFSGFGGTVLSLSSYWYSQEKVNESLVAQWFADWSSSLSTEVKVSKRKYESAPRTFASLPQVTLTFTGPPPAGTTGATRALVFGTEQFRHFNQLATDTLDSYLAGTWTRGAHEIKFGLDYQRNEIFNAFINNSKGVYEFRGADPVALFAAGVPTTYSLRVPINNYTIADGAANWTLDNVGLFLQDTWKLAKDFTLLGGVRVDRTMTSDKPARNPTFKAAFGYDNDTTLDGKTLVQPRLGFNWNLTPALGRATQVRGGAGLFEGAASNVWLTNPYQNTGVFNASFSCGIGTTPCPASVVFTPDTANQPPITGSVPAAGVDLIAPNARQPSVWKFNLALDTELPWWGLVAGVEWLHTDVRSGLNYRHLNLGAPTAAGPDGRPLFYNAQGLAAASWNGTDAPTSTAVRNRFNRNAAFGDVLIAESSGKGKGDALTLSLGGNLQRVLNWNVAYTYTKATEVSPLSSSTAISNWNGRATFDPNEDVATRSPYEVRDRVTSSLTYSKAFIGSYKTSFGMFYEGRRGKPYSWTFRNDMNGDGIAGNDLMYIPSAPGSGEVLFYGASAADRQANENRFWEIVNANAELSGARGRVVSRHGSTSPWVNSVDVRLSQEVPGFTAKQKGVISFDILNFGNLLNKRWGRTDEVGFNGGFVGGVLNRGGNARSFVNFAGISNGKYVYNTTTYEDFTTKQDRNESQWMLQVTLRYEF